MTTSNLAVASKAERRRHRRAAVNRPARLRVADGPVMATQLMNISSRGAALFFSAPLKAGIAVQLEFKLNIANTPVNIDVVGRVIEVHRRGESHLIRVLFPHPSPEAIKAIRDYLVTHSRTNE